MVDLNLLIKSVGGPQAATAINQVATSINNLNTISKAAGVAMTSGFASAQVKAAISGVDTATKSLNSTLTQTNTSINQARTAIAPLTNALTQSANAMTQVTSGAVTFRTNLASLTTGVTANTTAVTTNNTQWGALNTAMATVNTNLTTARTNFTNLTSGVTPLNTALATTNTTLATTETNLAGIESAAASSTTGWGALNNAVTQSSGSLTKYNTLSKTVTSTTDTLTKSTTNAGTATSSLNNFFSGNRGLIYSLTGIGTAGIEAIGMFSLLIDSQTRASAAQTELNSLQQQGITSGQDYVRAQTELKDANRALGFQTRIAVLSFSDLIPFTLNAANAFSKMESGTTRLGGAFSKIKGGLSNIGNELKGVFSGAARELGLMAGATTAADVAFAAFSARVESEAGVKIPAAMTAATSATTIFLAAIGAVAGAVVVWQVIEKTNQINKDFTDVLHAAGIETVVYRSALEEAINPTKEFAKQSQIGEAFVKKYGLSFLDAALQTDKWKAALEDWTNVANTGAGVLADLGIGIKTASEFLTKLTDDLGGSARGIRLIQEELDKAFGTGRGKVIVDSFDMITDAIAEFKTQAPASFDEVVNRIDVPLKNLENILGKNLPTTVQNAFKHIHDIIAKKDLNFMGKDGAIDPAKLQFATGEIKKSLEIVAEYYGVTYEELARIIADKEQLIKDEEDAEKERVKIIEAARTELMNFLNIEAESHVKNVDIVARANALAAAEAEKNNKKVLDKFLETQAKKEQAIRDEFALYAGYRADLDLTIKQQEAYTKVLKPTVDAIAAQKAEVENSIPAWESMSEAKYNEVLANLEFIKTQTDLEEILGTSKKAIVEIAQAQAAGVTAVHDWITQTKLQQVQDEAERQTLIGLLEQHDIYVDSLGVTTDALRAMYEQTVLNTKSTEELANAMETKMIGSLSAFSDIIGAEDMKAFGEAFKGVRESLEDLVSGGENKVIKHFRAMFKELRSFSDESKNVVTGIDLIFTAISTGSDKIKSKDIEKVVQGIGKELNKLGEINPRASQVYAEVFQPLEALKGDELKNKMVQIGDTINLVKEAEKDGWISADEYRDIHNQLAVDLANGKQPATDFAGSIDQITAAFDALNKFTPSEGMTKAFSLVGNKPIEAPEGTKFGPLFLTPDQEPNKPTETTTPDKSAEIKQNDIIAAQLLVIKANTEALNEVLAALATTFSTLTTNGSAAASVLLNMSKDIDLLVASTALIVAANNLFNVTLNTITQNGSAAASVILNTSKDLDQLAASTALAIAANNLFNVTLNTITQNGSAMAETVLGMSTAIDANTESTDAGTKANNTFNRTLGVVAGAAVTLTDNMEDLSSMIADDYVDAVDEGVKANNTFNRTLETVGNAADAAADKVSDLASEIEDLPSKKTVTIEYKETGKPSAGLAPYEPAASSGRMIVTSSGGGLTASDVQTLFNAGIRPSSSNTMPSGNRGGGTIVVPMTVNLADKSYFQVFRKKMGESRGSVM